MDKLFTHLASVTSKIAGRPWTFMACLGIVILWAVSGPIFKFNETWQLVINTGTTIITFLMVFLIQNTQNRDSAAIHAKIDELLHAVRSADERFIGIERLTDKELDVILQEVEGRAQRLHKQGLPRVATRAEDARADAKAAEKGKGSQAARKPRGKA
ncbi:MAG: low affinity iron permease family protein [Brevundimonas sp.]|nr:MAG: low affinity iron permease family protein [Brevundimonas sp.]